MPHPPPAAARAAQGPADELVLDKPGRRWVFRYRPGQEAELLRTLAHTASDPRTGLSWHDAAALARQLGARLAAAARLNN